MGVKVDVSALKDFKQRLETLTDSQVDAFMNRAVRECANWLLSLVIPRTPVGKVHGGTLRRGWLNNTGNQAGKGAGTNVSASQITARANSMNVERGKRGGYSVTVTNPVYYASYVEYGHRQTPGRYVPAIGKRLVKNWVEGQHFLKLSEEELREIAPEMLEELLNEFLRTVF
jgi:hypothetical protein